MFPAEGGRLLDIGCGGGTFLKLALEAGFDAYGLEQSEEAVRIGAKVLWLQLGVRTDEAARIAEEAGLTVVMNRCPKIEYARLSGELGWNGINSHVISSKKRRL